MAKPTALAKPWPSGPVVISTPGVILGGVNVGKDLQFQPFSFNRRLSHPAPAGGVDVTLRTDPQTPGVALLSADPLLGGSDTRNVETLVKQLVDLGLDGMEVFYGTHNPREVKMFKKMADKYGLIATGGSDYHGKSKPDIDLGVGMGNLKVDYGIVEQLKEKVSAKNR